MLAPDNWPRHSPIEPLRKYGGLAAILLLVLASTWGISAWRHRFVRSDRDLFHFLPARPGTTLFVDVNLLRRGGFLERFVAPKTVVRDPDYETFVRETGFDYIRDLNTLAAKNGSAKKEAKKGSVPISSTVLLAKGHFDWSRLRSYAMKSGGSCQGDFCRLASKTGHRKLAFREIQPDVLQLFIGFEAAENNTNIFEQKANKKGSVPIFSPIFSRENGSVPISDSNSAPRSELPDAPVWLKLGPGVLSNPAELPLPLRIFAISLASATSVVLSLGPAAEASNAAFVLKFKAKMPNSAAAGTARTQLELQTKMLKMGLKRAHEKPDPAGLTGLLTAGSFETSGTTVSGLWPVRRELLLALQ